MVLPSSQAVRAFGMFASARHLTERTPPIVAGPVQVLASVNGPLEVRLRDEIVDRAHLEVNVRPAKGLPGEAPRLVSDRRY